MVIMRSVRLGWEFYKEGLLDDDTDEKWFVSFLLIRALNIYQLIRIADPIIEDFLTEIGKANDDDSDDDEYGDDYVDFTA